MAQASETSASGPLFGELEAIFGSDEAPKPVYRDRAIRELERELTSDINLSRGGLYDALRKYRRAQGANTPFLRSATMESDAALRGALDRDTPLQDLYGVGDYLSGLFQKQVAPYIDPIARNIYNQTTVNNLARGIGGNPAGSSYSDLLRGRILGQTAADYGSRMMGMLPSLFPQLQGANQARFNELLNILPARRAGFEALEARAMNPYMAQLAGLRDLQGLAMGQNALNMGNLQGYQPVQNWANRLGAAGRATTANINQIFDWAQQASQIYGNLAGGGGMMGGGGGGGGLGGLSSLFGGRGDRTDFNPYTAPLSSHGLGAPGSMGSVGGVLGSGYYPRSSYNSYPSSFIGDINAGFQPYA